jgi:hypothetical protein
MRRPHRTRTTGMKTKPIGLTRKNRSQKTMELNGRADGEWATANRAEWGECG